MELRTRGWDILAWAKGLIVVAAIASLCAEFNLSQFRSAFARWPAGQRPSLASRLGTWDVAHYLRLSQDGYEAGSKSCAFYPLWPATIRLGASLTGGRPLLAATLLANALSLVGLWMLYRLMERHYGPEISRDALILLLASPGALFLSFAYSESVYLSILMVFFWGLELDRWSWVAVAGFLLPLTRATGVFVLAPLAWWLWEKRRAEGGELRACRRGRGPRSEEEPAETPRSPVHAPRAWLLGIRAWLLLLWPLLGYVAYFALMRVWTGNALEGFAAQKAYPNSPSISNMFDVTGFSHALVNVQTLDGMMDSALDRGFFLIFLASLLAIYRLSKLEFFYVLPAGLVPALTSWFMSYRRYFVVLFPTFVVLALLLREAKSRFLFWSCAAALAALQACALTRFLTFNWAG